MLNRLINPVVARVTAALQNDRFKLLYGSRTISRVAIYAGGPFGFGQRPSSPGETVELWHGRESTAYLIAAVGSAEEPVSRSWRIFNADTTLCLGVLRAPQPQILRGSAAETFRIDGVRYRPKCGFPYDCGAKAVPTNVTRPNCALTNVPAPQSAVPYISAAKAVVNNIPAANVKHGIRRPTQSHKQCECGNQVGVREAGS